MIRFSDLRDFSVIYPSTEGLDSRTPYNMTQCNGFNSKIDAICVENDYILEPYCVAYEDCNVIKFAIKDSTTKVRLECLKFKRDLDINDLRDLRVEAVDTIVRSNAVGFLVWLDPTDFRDMVSRVFDIVI